MRFDRRRFGRFRSVLLFPAVMSTLFTISMSPTQAVGPNPPVCDPYEGRSGWWHWLTQSDSTAYGTSEIYPLNIPQSYGWEAYEWHASNCSWGRYLYGSNARFHWTTASWTRADCGEGQPYADVVGLHLPAGLNFQTITYETAALGILGGG